jgi:hypothetical protein
MRRLVLAALTATLLAPLPAAAQPPAPDRAAAPSYVRLDGVEVKVQPRTR